MARKSANFGVIVVDAIGVVQFQSGLGVDPGVQAALLGKKPHTISSTILGVKHDGRELVALCRATEDATVFFVHASDDGETLFDFVTSVDFSFAILNHLVSSPYEAMTVIDAAGRVRYISPVHAKFFGLVHGEGIGKHVTEVIENTRLHEIIRTGKAEIGHVQEMQGVSRVVSRVPITQHGQVVGVIGQVMFKAPEKVHELAREVTRLKSEVTFYKRELSGMRNRNYGLEQIVGGSEEIRRLKSDIVKIAPLDVSVLLTGESGTGKELAAHAIHSLSPRHARPLVLINAAALPAGLIESELFGYEPGAFTGAEKKGRKGKFEQADKGTLFLDEIGDMPAEMQVKLLRVLQDRMVERIGSDTPRYSDYRLISASNHDLQQLVDGNKFRLDLYYRISSITLQIPPLRERLEDIPDLVTSFLHAYAQRHHATPKRVHKHVYAYLRELAWPGNVRQLLHEVEKAAIFCEGNEITVAEFRPSFNVPNSADAQSPASTSQTIRDAVEDVEFKLIKEALARYDGNKKRAAQELGISRSYLYKKLAVLQ